MNEIPVMEAIYQRNEELAEELNKKLTERGIFTVNVMGAPGVGKTTSLVQIIKRLSCPAAVIEGDIESSIDTEKLTEMGINAYQINTQGGCHLDSPLISEAVGVMSLEPGVLFIENIGNLVCPAEFMIGEHIKLLISTVTEGSDKPYKYPLAFEKADIILVNKCDLIPHVDFDRDYYMKGVSALTKTAKVVFVSSKTGEGFDEVATWLTEKAMSIK